MATSSAKRLLTANGFKYQREATHGEIWGDGDRTIMLSRNAEAEHPGLKKDLRNALHDRAQKNPFAPPPLTFEAQQEDLILSKNHEPVREPVHQKEPSRPRTLPLLVMTILTDPDLTDGQKVKMIMAYAELE